MADVEEWDGHILHRVSYNLHEEVDNQVLDDMGHVIPYQGEGDVSDVLHLPLPLGGLPEGLHLGYYVVWVVNLNGNPQWFPYQYLQEVRKYEDVEELV